MSAPKVTLADFTVSTAFDSDEVVGSLRRYGAAVMPGLVPRGELAALREEFKKVLEERDESFAYVIDYAAGRAVSIMRNKLPDGKYSRINAFFQHPKMRAVTDRYVGHPCLLNYEIYATHEFRPAVDVAPTHFDKLWTLKFMLYLDDVRDENAPFGVVPGSCTVARKRFRDIFETARLKTLSMSDERYQAMDNSDPEGMVGEVVDIVGPAGTLIAFDTDTFHHAAAVSDGRERMILRGHSGPSITYERVRKGSRQWWRGEKRYSRLDAWIDRIAEKM
jgi:ectoine hydroxylase-related dioxygenase (phytanoyl-CoA dioxygenase family)